jgi:RND family efflux transporter MFP subunit
MRRRPIVVFLLAGLLGLCALSVALNLFGRGATPVQRAPLPVRATLVTVSEYAPTLTLTGEIQARVQSDLSFRTAGRIVERKVEVGQHVEADTVLARIEPTEQQAGVRAAQASVAAAEAQLRQAQASFERQKTLLAQGFTTRKSYDQAEEAFRTAQSSLDAARAGAGTARDQLDYTVLRAGAPGIIVARNAEVGHVVQPAQTVFTLAQDGPRDAVFYVQESILAQAPESKRVEIALVSDPSVRTSGEVREVSPTADRTTGAVRVKVGLEQVPPAFTLCAAVTGTGRSRATWLTMLPASALSSDRGQPAVWVVDPATRRVELRRVDIERYESDALVIRDGLKPGEMVVTAGAQMLRPQQPVAVEAPQ